MFFRRKRPRPPGPDAIGELVERDVALARRLDPDSRSKLEDLTAELIDKMSWEALEGVELDDQVLVTIAANAAVPVLELGAGLYRNVSSIIVHPAPYQRTGVRAGTVSGVMSEDTSILVGEAAPNSSPVSLVWGHVLANSRHPERGHNVVIHELAHKIDMSDGYADGVPPLRRRAADDWRTVLDDEFADTEPALDGDDLRSYAWTNLAEFFAVATERFFCTPAELRAVRPRLYDALSGFYRQDPPGVDRDTSP